MKLLLNFHGVILKLTTQCGHDSLYPYFPCTGLMLDSCFTLCHKCTSSYGCVGSHVDYVLYMHLLVQFEVALNSPIHPSHQPAISSYATSALHFMSVLDPMFIRHLPVQFELALNSLIHPLICSKS